MNRWRIFWAAYLVVGGVVDAWREDRDIAAGRTHSNGTTLSSSTRWAVETLPCGRTLFPFLCWLIPHWFEAHILRNLDSKLADW